MNFDNNEEGFQHWCKELDDVSRKKSKKFLKKYNALVKDVPCYSDFFKYAQWHNLAHESTETMLPDVPLLIIHYEDYILHLNETANTILDFLESEKVHALPAFSARSDYGAYFTDDQQRRIRKWVEAIASNTTWSRIEHYFSK